MGIAVGEVGAAAVAVGSGLGRALDPAGLRAESADAATIADGAVAETAEAALALGTGRMVMLAAGSAVAGAAEASGRPADSFVAAEGAFGSGAPGPTVR